MKISNEEGRSLIVLVIMFKLSNLFWTMVVFVLLTAFFYFAHDFDVLASVAVLLAILDVIFNFSNVSDEENFIDEK